MIQNVFSLLVLVTGAWVILGNWWTVVVCIVTRKHSSYIPIIGGALGSLGCLLSPFPVLNKLWWLPLILDWGSLPGLGYAAIYFAVSYLRRGKGDKSN